MSKTKLHTKQIRPAATIANAPSGKVIGIGTDEVILEYKNGYKHLNVPNIFSNDRNIIHTNTTASSIRESELSMLSPLSPNTTVLIAGVDTSSNKFTTDGNQRLTLVNNSDTSMFIISKFINDNQAGRFSLLPYGIVPLYARTAYDFYYRDTGFMMVSPVSQSSTASTYNAAIVPFVFPTANLEFTTTNATISELSVSGSTATSTPVYRLESPTNASLPSRATLSTLHSIYRPSLPPDRTVLIRYTFVMANKPASFNAYNITCRLTRTTNITEADPVHAAGVRLNLVGSNYNFQVFSKDLAGTSVTTESPLSTVTAADNVKYTVELLIHNNRQVTATVNKVYIGTVISNLIATTGEYRPTIHLERTNGTDQIRIDVESITIETF